MGEPTGKSHLVKIRALIRRHYTKYFGPVFIGKQKFYAHCE